MMVGAVAGRRSQENCLRKDCGEILNRRAGKRKQAGKALTRRQSDVRLIIFPDGGSRPMKDWILRHQSRLRDGYVSHNNGRHKLG
jgi:hypothetical protein